MTDHAEFYEAAKRQLENVQPWTSPSDPEFFWPIPSNDVNIREPVDHQQKPHNCWLLNPVHGEPRNRISDGFELLTLEDYFISEDAIRVAWGPLALFAEKRWLTEHPIAGLIGARLNFVLPCSVAGQWRERLKVSKQGPEGLTADLGIKQRGTEAINGT